MSTLLPPSNEQVEQALLGSLVIDPSVIPLVSSIVKKEDFYYVKNQWIYESILGIGSSTDLLSLENSLERRQILDEVGGSAYLAELTSSVPNALNAEHYARLVNEYSTRRNLLTACSEIAKLAYAQAEPMDSVLDKANTHFVKACRTSANIRVVDKEQACDQYMESFDGMIEGTTPPGIASGLQEFDRLFGGWKGGKLYVFGGLPGSGKTTLMLNLLLQAARADYHAAMFSCEMTEEELVSVCISHLVGRFDSEVNLSSGTLYLYSPENRERIRRLVGLARAELERLPIRLFCLPGMNPTQFAFELKRLKASEGLDIAAADYIQIMSPPASAKNQGREREVAAISEELKRTAMDAELRVPILTGTQLNDEGQVRESRAIWQNADGLVILSSDGGYVLDVDVSKNRGGPVGKFQLRFVRHRAAILSMGGAGETWVTI